MQDRIESVLLDLYYSTVGGEWSFVELTQKEKKETEDYVITKIFNDPLGKPSVYYKLSSAGELIAEFILNKYGRSAPSGVGGLVLERRRWLMPKRHNLKVRKIISAFRKIAKRGKIPIEIKKDWQEKRQRVIFRDLDRGIARISFEIEWETNRHLGEKYLIDSVGFDEIMAWVWVSVFDLHRSEIRSCHFQQEFIIWDG